MALKPKPTSSSGPKIPPQTVRLSPDLYAAVERVATAERRSKSNVYTTAIAEHVARHDPALRDPTIAAAAAMAGHDIIVSLPPAIVTPLSALAAATHRPLQELAIEILATHLAQSP